MSSVAIAAVLSRCPDVVRVLESLCWTPDTWPEPEQIEALKLLIDGVGASENGEQVLSKVKAVILEQCLPLLVKISASAATGGVGRSQRSTTDAVCGLLASCLALCGADVARELALLTMPALAQCEDADGAAAHAQDQLHLDVAVEVLAVLLPRLSSDAQLTLTCLSCALSAVKVLPEPRAAKVLLRVLLTLLNASRGERRDDALRRAWRELCRWRAPARALLCLTALSDLYFPASSPGVRADLRGSPAFWTTVQAGLTHGDNVARKRAQYLLRRAVAQNQQFEVLLSDDCYFRWVPSEEETLRLFWEDYLLVMETLEENQIHVIRPVLNRLDTLVITTAGGPALVHPSWLLCAYQRMFRSENQAVVKEGVRHLMELNLLQQPSFALAYAQFIVGPFMDSLADSSLFHRSPSQKIGECPEVGLKIQEFMVTFFGSLPQECRGASGRPLLQRLGSHHWCAVPLLFLAQALARLPTRPLLGPPGLHALREVLCCTMITHQVLLRGAAQCFLLHSALCLTDVSIVTLDEIFGFLVHFRSDESLCRGTVLWDQLCQWLLENEGKFAPTVGNPDAPGRHQTETGIINVRTYVQQRLEVFLVAPAMTDQADSLPDPGEAEVLARAILLSADMDVTRLGEEEAAGRLETLLRPLLEVLRRLSTNVYLPVCKSDRSLQLLLRLLQLQRRRGGLDDWVEAAMKTLVLQTVEEVQEFLARRLSGELQEVCDVERAGLYLSLLREALLRFSHVEWYRCSVQDRLVPRLIQACRSILTEPTEQGQVPRAVAMAVLSLLCEVAEGGVLEPQSEAMLSLGFLSDYFHLSPEHFNQPLVKPAAQQSDSPFLRDWGRIAAHFIRDQWTCLGFLQRSAAHSGSQQASKACVALQAAVEALGLLPSDLVLPLLDFMASVLPQVMCEEFLCVEAVTASWKVVLGLSGNARDFWSTLQSFVQVAFGRGALELREEEAPNLTKSLHKLIELGQAKMGVFNVLIRQCCCIWLPSGSESESGADGHFSSAMSHLDILTEACLYGPVFRRDQRLIQEVQTYVEQLGEACAANSAVSSDNRDEQFPRVCAVAFLSRLQPHNHLHQTLMEALLLRLLEKDQEIAKSKVRYYSNSLQHRVKNRVWQTVLLLLPKLRTEFVVGTVLGRVFEAAFCSNQASVKYLIEWAMVLILYNNPSCMEQLWECFSVDQEKTKTSVCTFLSVLVHMNILLPKVQDKVGQWSRALEVILQSCFSHNFSVRLYALLALKKVWSLEGARSAAEEALGGSSAIGGLATVVQACLHQADVMQNSGNAMKNWLRIQAHFFFSVFHPLRDYSVETIFYTFPSLSELSDDEWIPLWKFERMVEFSPNPQLPLRNPGQDLIQACGVWIQQDRGNDLEQEERWAEVQKKIMPWNLSIQEQEPLLAAQQRSQRLGKMNTALLVVASLIDKPTNLGGLCRTCEIFGASALVLDSLRHVGDKHFQALSVSSELWLPMLEVKPVELVDFLQLKKREGYCIIGVEQTANSQNLQDFKFPEKTLLLLGNEREGIPANLLQMLDVCVEIPQHGVTRSLNVHVSAALLVWEYTRQHKAPPPSR
uniref:tRNA (guanosine(18)-2'-O)-methyltransferase TARBP1 n=1 Tax=Denticeps clupeoides TaxID=299321 RepID=A0AAY4CYJ9_9TELE